MPHLIVVDARGRRMVEIDKPLMTIGRRTESDVQVAGVDVSRVHAELQAENGVYRLRDCGSRFGLVVNGEPTTNHVLAHGDHIRLGKGGDTEITFLLRHDDSPVTQSVVAAANELRHTAALLEGLRALGSARVLDDVLALVLDSAINVTRAERGFILLANTTGELELKLGRGRGRVALSGGALVTSRKIPEAVFTSGRQMLVEDLPFSEWAHLHQGTIADGIRYVACAPLRLVQYVDVQDQPAEERVIGVLYLDSRKGTLHSTETGNALETLSIEAALAIENARLYREALVKAKYDEELKMAASIQAALLPPGSRSGAFFATAATCVACHTVGGDFFDYVDLPDGRFGFILGDVSGKGSPAALLAAAALGMFCIEARHQTRAAPVMAALNAGLFRRGVEARFMTSIYGILSPDGTFIYSNAGHNPPILLTSQGFRRLETGGLILGVFEDAFVDEETLTLERGNCIVLYSDGITEARNAVGEQFGESRLLLTLEAHRHEQPGELVSALAADVRRFCGDAPQSDDLTIVAIRYEGCP